MELNILKFASVKNEFEMTDIMQQKCLRCWSMGVVKINRSQLICLWIYKRYEMKPIVHFLWNTKMGKCWNLLHILKENGGSGDLQAIF